MSNQYNPESLFQQYPEVLNTKQHQDALGIGRAGVLKLLANGKIESFKIGGAYKIPRTALVKYIESVCPVDATEVSL